MQYSDEHLRYLRLLSQKYQTVAAAASEIIRIEALLRLPKGTEHFMSDLHGEHEAFVHILNSASGVIREKIDTVLGNGVPADERAELATLVYYPNQKLPELKARQKDLHAWYRMTLLRLIDRIDVVRQLDESKLPGYIAAACRHTAYNVLCHNRRHPQVPLEDAPEASSAPDMDELLSRRVELNALARVWPRLDEDTRWLLEARYILDYSDSELAREMGVKPTSVRMALTRARKKARAMLRPELEKM